MLSPTLQYILYIQKGFWLTCWANWSLQACRFVSLWATNPEVPSIVASRCRSLSCCDWPCSYRIFDSGTGGCSKVHRNSRTVTLHQLTANTAVFHLLGLESQCCISFRDNAGHPHLPSVKDCLVLSFVLLSWVDPPPQARCGGGGIGPPTQASLGVGAGVPFGQLTLGCNSNWLAQFHCPAKHHL